MPSRRAVPTVLSVAGSDSGGGAGVQADLKAIAACGAHGMTAITALTAQSTSGVFGVHPVPPDFVERQVAVVAADLGVDAVKTGMLGTAPTVAAVCRALDGLPPGTPVVVDPVMVAESGAALLDVDARAAVRDDLLRRATVVTPNLPEARVLAGADEDEEDVEALARALHALGPRAVVVTGGHRAALVDVLFDGERVVAIAGPRHPDGAAHGSGCTHASALAARLALGDSVEGAARVARAVASAAVRDGLRHLGAGAGPVDALGVRARQDLLAGAGSGRDGGGRVAYSRP